MSDGAPSAPDTTAPDTRTPSDHDLESWIADRRWYASKGSVPRLRTISTDDGTRLVLDEAPAVPVLYQAPITSGPDGTVVDATTDLDGVPVLLCWLEGDEELLWYHRADLGFAGRRRLPQNP